MFMRIESPAFSHEGVIPVRYTCDGDNISPPLAFFDIPERSQSLALVVDDPDAPLKVWTHWVVWNIRPDTATVAEGEIPAGGVEGMTDFGKRRWGGPCPPSGTHRYFFTLYALDTILDIDPASEKEDVEQAMEGHVIEKAELMGLYQRT